ncbi:uracil phosphoribosyltransferase [Dysgonomonas sp. PFB1-18]|uniref:uracil phosphoribosyltransferase n=1 Tax=unclassified Dysgonomonas TaxID=2630389 RepID=UPI002473879A|nr:MULTISPECIES: uracil phosphoribosyltransferase [unclassified Dysgonomonas]MDH6308270.1 uracil phosphoribosyltransferase [Dysgonomonas sp. PF1-14]MDH6338291.1 uracil phosphoribosyltransferase [Dysgonomonas sp. PF1-16]MDH6379788.1 uracil phosphoribosyltransferase [Dysgonomonas sp. PFB1-18]MDH6397122.1 uracil phosphoribosyltransferase [Dysgonomonas sp. PF1-23]
MKTINLSEQNTILNRFVSELRDVNIQTDSMRFRRNVERIGEIMAYEISKSLNYAPLETQTPLGTSVTNVPTDPIVIGTILRAGLVYHHGFLNCFDKAENAFVSAYRKYRENHQSFHVHIEYIASPKIQDKVLILTDPMLATGGSMDLSYQALITKGEPKHVHIATIIASRQAIEYCEKSFPQGKTTIWAAAIDPELNESAYIIPGLGDAGDLAYGEKE